MNKCLKILLNASIKEGFLQDVIQKAAKKLNLEGTAQIMPTDNKIKIIVCGDKDAVDQFLDSLHKSLSKASFDDLEIEPFLKDKDYRGVFRVIE